MTSRLEIVFQIVSGIIFGIVFEIIFKNIFSNKNFVKLQDIIKRLKILFLFFRENGGLLWWKQKSFFVLLHQNNNNYGFTFRSSSVKSSWINFIRSTYMCPKCSPQKVPSSLVVFGKALTSLRSWPKWNWIELLHDPTSAAQEDCESLKWQGKLVFM